MRLFCAFIMRLGVFLLLAALLFTGCTGGQQGASNQVQDSGNAVGPENTQLAQDSVQPTPAQKEFHLSAVLDMLVFNGKLYFVGSTRTEAAYVYEYTGDKTPPKKLLSLGPGKEYDFDDSSDDPRLKGKGMQLNSLVEYEGTLYAAGETGLFKMNQNGAWEMMDLVPPNAKPEAGIVIYRMKKLPSGTYALASYAIESHDQPGFHDTFSVLKFLGDRWEVVYDKLLQSRDLVEYGGEIYLTGDADLEKLAVKNGKTFLEDVQSSAPESLDTYSGIGRFSRIGTDGNAVYVCGEGKRVFKFDGSWSEVGKVGETCLFFKQAGGVLYFGTQHDEYSHAARSEVGLFKIEEGKVKQVASGEFVSPGSIIEYNGEVIVGGHAGSNGVGGLYKIKNGNLEKIAYYEG